MTTEAMDEGRIMLATGGDRRKVPAKHPFRRMTKAEVLALSAGQRVRFLSTDGSCRELTINGRVRTWKRDPERVEVPVKYGLYEYGCFGLEEAMHRLLVALPEEEVLS